VPGAAVHHHPRFAAAPARRTHAGEAKDIVSEYDCRVLLHWDAVHLGVRVEGLGLSSHSHGQVTVVAVRGELDAVTSREFDEYLTTARRHSDHIILDLAAVDFMDTSSLAVIVGHWKKLTARNGILALAGARYRYTKTLWITGLADRLPRYDTLEQAIAAVSAGGNRS
jgi:anti-sigma B factor antagonist